MFSNVPLPPHCGSLYAQKSFNKSCDSMKANTCPCISQWRGKTEAVRFGRHRLNLGAYQAPLSRVVYRRPRWGARGNSLPGRDRDPAITIITPEHSASRFSVDLSLRKLLVSYLIHFIGFLFEISSTTASFIGNNGRKWTRPSFL